MENPFKPTITISDSSQIPDIMIDSEVRSSNIIRHLLENVGKYKTLVISGYLGEGKTTTLFEVAREISDRENWLTVSLSMKSDNVIADFAAALKEYELIGLNQSSYRILQDKKFSNEHYIIKVLTSLTKKGYNTLVTLDDVVVNDDCELLKFAAFYRRLATKKIAISTLLAATTDVTSAICTDKLLTVLLAPQIVKLPLNELQVHVTYHDVFKKGKRLMTGGACSEAARYVSYFGYTFQVVGYLLWENTAEGDKIPVAKVRESEPPLPTHTLRGRGGSLGREFPKLSKQTILELESHLKKIFNNDFPLFELVINPNTSIINSTGLSNLPKVIWPNDLKKMKIQFIQNKLNFLLDGKPINLLYLGSIPPQQFRGAQKILLSLITPWRMVNNDGISNNIINHREIFN